MLHSGVNLPLVSLWAHSSRQRNVSDIQTATGPGQSAPLSLRHPGNHHINMYHLAKSLYLLATSKEGMRAYGSVRARCPN